MCSFRSIEATLFSYLTDTVTGANSYDVRSDFAPRAPALDRDARHLGSFASVCGILPSCHDARALLASTGPWTDQILVVA